MVDVQIGGYSNSPSLVSEVFPQKHHTVIIILYFINKYEFSMTFINNFY